MQKHKKLIVLLGVGAAMVFGIATAAVAETYSDPTGRVSIGTNGSDASPATLVAISQGGCVDNHTTIAVVVSTPGGRCPTYAQVGYVAAISQGGCASGHVGIAIGPSDCGGYGLVGLGVLGADSGGTIAVSDTGDAKVCDWPTWTVDCIPPSAAVSGTGSAQGETAVSGTGNASTLYAWGTAVSGTGTANAYCDQYNQNTVAVSGTNAASGCIAVSGTGHASGTTTVSGGDLLP